VTAFLLFVFPMRGQSGDGYAREAPRSVDISCDYALPDSFVDQYLQALVGTSQQIPLQITSNSPENTIPLKIGGCAVGKR